ncbi:hypothetical protein H6F96_09100, partial [Microcoleus sp. FACHB-53]|nr:hypothetical protein [Microcoleus sp. FACHB-53]
TLTYMVIQLSRFYILAANPPNLYLPWFLANDSHLRSSVSPPIHPNANPDTGMAWGFRRRKLNNLPLSASCHALT